MAATSDERGLVHGYRSGLEDKVAAQIASHGLAVSYEVTRFGFTPPLKQRHYTPDFVLPNGIIIETKGRFMTADRQKHKHIKVEHPDLDIRFVFSRANARLSKNSKTTYAMWCDQYGFRWAEGLIPTGWFSEPPCADRIAAIKRASKPVQQKKKRS
jgi:hypothetical protein